MGEGMPNNAHFAEALAEVQVVILAMEAEQFQLNAALAEAALQGRQSLERPARGFAEHHLAHAAWRLSLGAGQRLVLVEDIAPGRQGGLVIVPAHGRIETHGEGALTGIHRRGQEQDRRCHRRRGRGGAARLCGRARAAALPGHEGRPGRGALLAWLRHDLRRSRAAGRAQVSAIACRHPRAVRCAGRGWSWSREGLRQSSGHRRCGTMTIIAGQDMVHGRFANAPSLDQAGRRPPSLLALRACARWTGTPACRTSASLTCPPCFIISMRCLTCLVRPCRGSSMLGPGRPRRIRRQRCRARA